MIDRLLLACLLLSTTACASSTAWERVPVETLSIEEREEWLLTDTEAPRQRDRENCTVRMIPGGYPPGAGEIVDSAALHRALADRVEAWSEQGHAVFHLAWDSVGAPSETEVIDATLPETRISELSELLHQNRRPSPERPDAERITRARFRIDVSPDARMRVGWTTACPPVLRNRAAVTRALDAAVEAAPSRVLEDVRDGQIVPVVRQAVIYIFLDEEGVPIRTEVEDGSGHPATDQIALKIGAVMRFEPALENGRPVKVWVSMPVTMRP